MVARPLTLGQTLAVFAGLAAAVFAVLLMAVAATSGGSGDAAAQAAPAAPAPVAVPTGPPGAGPAVGSVFVSSQPPSLPDGGPNGAAIWLRDTTRLPAAPIALFAAAGIPARIVTSALDAFAHPLVLSWPSSALSTEELRLLAAYGAAGGTLLAVEPDVRTQQVLGYARGAVFARLGLVPETGASGGALRDMQVAALRRYWSGTPGGFRLGDAPRGRRRALVLMHDLRTPAAVAGAAAFARAEAEAGVRATYVVQPKYLADEAGPALLDAAQQAVAEVRARGGHLAVGGVVGSPLAGLPDGTGLETYPTYSPAYGSPTQLEGATTFGELRVGRHLVESIGGVSVNVFRGVGPATGEGFAAAAEAAGYAADATIAAPRALGSFPFLQSEAGGSVRTLLRFPVAFQDLPGERLDNRVGALTAALAANGPTGAPTLMAITPDDPARKLQAERAVLGEVGPGVWVGPLDELAAFWHGRGSVAMDVRPATGTRLWKVHLSAPSPVRGQTLVAPAPIAWARTPTGRRLPTNGHRLALPAIHGELTVIVRLRKPV